MQRLVRVLTVTMLLLFGCAWACTNDYDELAYTPEDSEPGPTGPGSGGPGPTGAGGSSTSGSAMGAGSALSAGGAP